MPGRGLTETRDAYIFLAPCLVILLGFVAYPFLDGIATALAIAASRGPATSSASPTSRALFARRDLSRSPCATRSC